MAHNVNIQLDSFQTESEAPAVPIVGQNWSSTGELSENIKF